MEEDEYWGTRNIAEYAYCPRLFYFMEVEKVQIASEDTEQGLLVHRRVDMPSNLNKEEINSACPKSIRSLTLTSKQYNLIGKLDLTEVNENEATPIEYRKGSPKKNIILNNIDEETALDLGNLSTSEPWTTDVAQVSLQAILLEENNFSVKKLVVYYNTTKQKFEIPYTKELRNDALKLLSDAKKCADGSRPLPLVNDRRCQGCSLQPLCLPDEVNQCQNINSANAYNKRIIPQRDDGKHIIVQAYGSRVGVNGSAFKVTDYQGKLLQEVPLAGVESVTILGNVQISTQAIHVVADKGVPIAYLSSAGRLIAFVDPYNDITPKLRSAQVMKLLDPNFSIELTRKLIGAKIHNQRTLLMRNASKLPEEVQLELKQELKKVQVATNIDSIRGHEGRAAAIYFKHFHLMLKPEFADLFKSNGRKKRPPPDPVNALLSFGYSMLAKECVASLKIARLDPAIGVFHRPKIGRPALALDLMEPFRPLIADSLAISLLNRGEMSFGHFQQTSVGAVMTDFGRKAFFKAYARRMDTQVTHPLFEYRLSYRRMLHVHARLLANWMVDELPDLEFLTTR